MSGDIRKATRKAIKAAHLTDQDSGAVEAMLALADKIDVWDLIVEYAMDDLADKAKEARPAVPQNDNVSISAYLKYAESLGLTPAGRAKIADVKKPEAKPSGKLASVSNIPRPTA